MHDIDEKFKEFWEEQGNFVLAAPVEQDKEVCLKGVAELAFGAGMLAAMKIAEAKLNKKYGITR